MINLELEGGRQTEYEATYSLSDHINDTGAGYSPDEEQPSRVTTQTPEHLEPVHLPYRQHILKKMAPILKLNEAFTNFCTDSASIVHLSVAPPNRHKIYRASYKLAASLHSAISDVIARWFAAGRIKHAPKGCPYNSPLLGVPKKDENGKMTGVRVCIDIRLLNDFLVEDDRFMIPRIPDLLAAFGGRKLFGEFDLSEAFTQFRLSEESQPYTAFMWDSQQYMFVGCPYGIKHIPSLFQRYISNLFRDMPFVFPYIDNIAFSSDSWEEHETHAIAIVERLNSVGLRIKPSSVNIGNSEIKLLGHLINQRGIGIDPEKLDMVSKWPLPLTGKALASVLGLGSFLRDHIRYYGDITAPLEKMKRDKGDLVWTPVALESWEAFKLAFANAPFLKFPDLNKRFCIAHDASQTGVGAVLYQPDDEDDTITPDNIVAIFSKQLNPSQQNYCPSHFNNGLTSSGTTI